MMIYLEYLTYGEICDRLLGFQDTDLASLRCVVTKDATTLMTRIA